ncbi:SdpI family protein [Clostridium chromiireducens]|uniref:SdpI family protein n=2 Tax=Clostridium chromiireducens TaxID=225345 RepID=A0A399IS71_9CLOT|nr:SdpI family protein [Clostridium chromiireducens]
MMLITNILTSVIFIVVGAILKLRPPKKINSVYGYRTFFAMKNKETWKEGNSFSAVMMLIGGSISLSFSLLITLLLREEPNLSSVISITGSLLITFSFTLYTEIYLRRIFDEEGIRKTK